MRNVAVETREPWSITRKRCHLFGSFDRSSWRQDAVIQQLFRLLNDVFQDAGLKPARLRTLNLHDDPTAASGFCSMRSAFVFGPVPVQALSKAGPKLHDVHGMLVVRPCRQEYGELSLHYCMWPLGSWGAGLRILRGIASKTITPCPAELSDVWGWA